MAQCVECNKDLTTEVFVCDTCIDHFACSDVGMADYDKGRLVNRYVAELIDGTWGCRDRDTLLFSPWGNKQDAANVASHLNGITPNLALGGHNSMLWESV